MTGEVGTCYIIRLSKKLAGHARYYLGWCRKGKVEARFYYHRTGRGARILQVARERRIGMRVIATLDNQTRSDERRWKNWKNHEKVLKRWQNMEYPGGRVEF